MNTKQSLSILLLIVGTLLLAACSNTSSNLPQPNQPDKNINDPTPLESFNVLETKLTASDPSAQDNFSHSVAISGNTAIVGAPFDRSFDNVESGSAYVFTRSNTGWTQQTKLIPNDAKEGQQFGISVAISGDTVIVGAPIDNDKGEAAGAIYVFTRSGTTWNQQAKFTASDGSEYDEIGRRIAIDKDTIIVGNAGKKASYIFTRSGTTWSQQAKLFVNEGSGAFRGNVAISGDTAIVEAVQSGENPAFAYVFTRSGTTWSQQAKLITNDGSKPRRSFSLDGDTFIACGRDYHHPEAAYVFTRSGTNWTQQTKLTASDGVSGDDFGYSVAISGDLVIVGARYDDSGYRSGSAYIFSRSGTNWTQQAKLLASDGSTSQDFGGAVSISGDTAIVGAQNHITSGGAAYIYEFTSEEPPDTGISTAYVSSSSSGNAGGISFANEDILAFDTSTSSWSLYFDGSDVGLSAADVDAFHLQSDGSLLLSLQKDVFTIPSFATVRASDIIKFTPTSTGENTQGNFEWYFDGSDVGLGSSEGIDAIGLTTDGDLLVSFTNNFTVPSLRGTDKDLLVFNADSLGRDTAGTWSLYFDGSDVLLDETLENVYGVWLHPNNGDLYLTTKGTFAVTGLNGDADDIFTFTPNTLGNKTSGSFNAFWNGDKNGFVNERLDGLFLQ